MKINSPNIIDIRENYLYNMGHIINSKNISYSILDKLYYKYLDKDKTYYLYCSGGHNSKKLASKLNDLGYHVYSINEGYNSFKNILS